MIATIWHCLAYYFRWELFSLLGKILHILFLSETYPMQGSLFFTLSDQKVRNVLEPNKRTNQCANLLQSPRHPAKGLRGQHP